MQTDKAGTLEDGDQFRLPSTEPGQVFTFRGIRRSRTSGQEHVAAYGGDAHPEGRRAWRAFTIEQVKADARPPGRLARKGRNAQR